MGRVLVILSLATLVFVAVLTVDASTAETRRGADHAALLGKRLMLERGLAKLVERRAGPSSLTWLVARARRVDLPLWVPGLPEPELAAGPRPVPVHHSRAARRDGARRGGGGRR